jgi:DNA end-binding protein Ku
VSRKTVRFHQLNSKTGTRIAQKRVDPSSGDEVAYEDIVKGFELSKDRYVVITPDELESLEPEKTRSIDIEGFVDLDEIDPVYYDHPYYLAPGKGAAKAYKLLLDGLAEANKVAIARVVIRSKQSLVAIRPRDGVLAMETMLFADEVVPPDSIDEMELEGNVKTTKKELDMAHQLIDSLTTEFDPAQYRDDYRDSVLDLIERKAQGEEIVIEEAPAEAKEVPDLMAALEASIASAKSQGGDAKKKKTAARKKTGAGSKKATAKKS